MWRAAVLVIAAVGCSKKPTPELPEALHGAWVIWCYTTDAEATECLGKDRVELHQTFDPGGRVTLSTADGPPTQGTWKLTGDRLEVSYSGGGLSVGETWRVRPVDDRLVMWDARNRRGKILGRPGAKLEPAPSPTSNGRAQELTLDGVRFTIALPAGSRKTRDVTSKQAWGPSSGEGFEVRLSVSKRAQTQIEGKWVTPPCNDRDYGGESGSRGSIGGAERDISIGTSYCLDDDRVLMCSAEHTRGYLEPSELKPASALCKSIALAR
ncbi:MAG: lipocalin family protein [Deltaproteobacteria bacterium]|nr:lipocalin family protein [Deltaproteobacteria bacterium]